MRVMEEENMDFKGFDSKISSKISPFFQEMLEGYRDNIHSLHIVGSVLTPDYDKMRSDINSVAVLKEMDIGFVKFLSPLGKKYRKRGIAAPLIMTPGYIKSSLDTFPIEFFNFRLIHRTVFGDDIFTDLNIDKCHMRLQCEREIKTKLIWLRQGYISSLGDKKLLTERLSDSITGYIPLFRVITSLLGQEPPVKIQDVILYLQDRTGIETGIFNKIFLLKRNAINLNRKELTISFEEYYRATERISKIIDELSV